METHHYSRGKKKLRSLREGLGRQFVKASQKKAWPSATRLGWDETPCWMHQNLIQSRNRLPTSRQTNPRSAEVYNAYPIPNITDTGLPAVVPCIAIKGIALHQPQFMRQQPDVSPRSRQIEVFQLPAIPAKGKCPFKDDIGKVNCNQILSSAVAGSGEHCKCAAFKQSEPPDCSSRMWSPRPLYHGRVASSASNSPCCTWQFHVICTLRQLVPPSASIGLYCQQNRQ